MLLEVIKMKGEVIVVVLIISIKIVEGQICDTDAVCGNGSFVHSYPYSEVCQPCFCSGGCTTETVCPVFDAITDEYEECRNEFSFFDLTESQIEILSGASEMSYFVVFKCPTGADSELKAACESTHYDKDVQFVSSASSYRIYKNEYCAQCHGEIDYVTWRKAVVVNIDAISDTINDIFTKIGHEDHTNLQDKLLISAPPNGYPENTNICDERVISKCNYNGRVDENVKALCKLSKFPLVGDYRNFYCALCNNKTTADCSLDYSGKAGSTIHRLLYLDDDIFSSVNDREDKDLTHCSSSQVVDPLNGVCLNFTCPFGHIPLMSECITIKSALEEIAFYFHVDIKASTVLSLDMQNLLLNWISEHLNAERCHHCQNMAMFIDSNTIKVFEGFTLINKCNLSKLSIVLQDFEKTISSEKTFQFSTGDIFTATFKMDYETQAFTKGGSKCDGDVQLWQKFYCSSIVMTPDTLSKLDRLGSYGDIYYVSEPYINNEVQHTEHTYGSRIICLSHYKRIVDKVLTNGIEHIHRSTFVVHFMFLCLLLFDSLCVY